MSHNYNLGDRAKVVWVNPSDLFHYLLIGAEVVILEVLNDDSYLVKFTDITLPSGYINEGILFSSSMEPILKRKEPHEYEIAGYSKDGLMELLKSPPSKIEYYV